MQLKLIVSSITVGVLLFMAYTLTMMSPASAFDVVFDPQNYSQNMLTAARALKTNLNEAQQLSNQATQLQNEARNLVKAPTEYWQRVQTNFEQLKALSQRNASLGQYLQAVNGQFNTIYPGYQPVQNYGNLYKVWTDNSLKTAESVTKTASAQQKLYDSAASQTQATVAQGASAEGALQAAQTQVALSGQMVTELQKIQQMQSEQATMQAAHIMNQVQDKASEKKATEEWLHRPFKPML